MVLLHAAQTSTIVRCKVHFQRLPCYRFQSRAGTIPYSIMLRPVSRIVCSTGRIDQPSSHFAFSQITRSSRPTYLRADGWSEGEVTRTFSSAEIERLIVHEHPPNRNARRVTELLSH